MSFVSEVTAAVEDVAAAAASGDLTKVPEEIEALKRILQQRADQLDNEGFQRLRLTPSAFGGSASAGDLGQQHELAHSVVADTIIGVARDLVGFRDGVVTFERAVDGADDDTAADLQKRQSGVEALVTSAARSEGDRRNHEAKGEYLGDEGDR